MLVSAVAVALMAMPAPLSANYRDIAAAPAMRTGTLMSELRLANESGDARGLLPPASCRVAGRTTVSCVAPAPGITGAVFRTYPSPQALYAAYVQEVKSLDSGRFRANSGDCGRSSPAVAGEMGWNHWFRDPRPGAGGRVPVATVGDPRAADRVFCVTTGGAGEDMVWTQDDGDILGLVSGKPHEDVWNWWAAIHHRIAFPCSSALAYPAPAFNAHGP